LLDFLWGELLFVVRLIRQFVIPDFDPITGALAEILFHKGVSLTKVDQLKINKAVILLVKYPKSLGGTCLAHLRLQGLVFGAEKLLAYFKIAMFWIFQ